MEEKDDVEYHEESWKDKVKLDSKSAEKLKEYAENLATDAQNFSMSFLPEETQKHIINMNKEALLAIKSIIDEGENFLGKPKKPE
jgi:hypothetical protein